MRIKRILKLERLFQNFQVQGSILKRKKQKPGPAALKTLAKAQWEPCPEPRPSSQANASLFIDTTTKAALPFTL